MKEVIYLDKKDLALQLTLKAMDKMVLPKDQSDSLSGLNKQLAQNVAEMYNIIYNSIDNDQSKE